MEGLSDRVRDLDPSVSRLYLFSHPNHEIAVHGSVRRLRPHLVYLTDGGGADRVRQTETGLAALGNAGNAHYLDYAEALVYAKLLERDMAFFDGAADRIAALIEDLQPDAIHCDAVEFYNPVHDLALPLALAAVRRTRRPLPIYEIPLVFQTDEDAPYRFQTVRPGWTGGVETLCLAEEEIGAKLAAARDNYTLLNSQLGGAFDHITAEQAATEVYMGPVPATPVAAAPGQPLRYEWRARRLLESGAIREMITYRDHFLPVAAHLCCTDGLAVT